jgi:hypothetical protein
MMDELNAKVDSNQAEMRSELKETTQHKMKAVIQPIQSELNEMTACNEATEPNPETMQSIEEHQVIPKEDAAVMPVRGPRKQHRVCNLATEHCHKMKES